MGALPPRTLSSLPPVDVYRATTPRRTTRLSRREKEMALLVSQGHTNFEIADLLSVSERTVKNTLHSVFKKAHVQDRLDLALWVVFYRMFRD